MGSPEQQVNILPRVQEQEPSASMKMIGAETPGQVLPVKVGLEIQVGSQTSPQCRPEGQPRIGSAMEMVLAVHTSKERMPLG